MFRFSKKQNKNGEMLDVTAFQTALARAGVEKSVVDDAIKEATKVKKGSTFYLVDLIEE
jgi:hypothetical protein